MCWSISRTRKCAATLRRFVAGTTNELELSCWMMADSGGWSAGKSRKNSFMPRHAAADIFWLNESIVPVLHELKASGQRLVLLSNTSITHIQFIERHYTVLDLMDDRVTSFEAGALKPESRIFEVALEKAQCTPEECFYTDDIAAYINKALTFGIHARLFTTTESLRQSLKELSVL